MTKTTREIFDKHEIRKTKVQKASFREYLTSYAQSLGYNVHKESVNKNAANVVVGDPSSAKVIYTAHYDTCAVTPFPNLITPKCIPLYLLYQIFISLVMLALPIFVMLFGSEFVYDKTGSETLRVVTLIGGYALLWGFIILMMKGPANKHTANDNTSGVTLLIDIMRDMPNELRESAAFIFFDLEEMGTVGSKMYKKKHPNIAKTKPVINFDCVSDGKYMLFVAKKNSSELSDKISEAFKSDDTYTVDVATKGVIYPSDQRNFEYGVGVSALNKTKHGLLYMNRIHTKRDTVYDEGNIEFLKTGAINLTRII